MNRPRLLTTPELEVIRTAPRTGLEWPRWPLYVAGASLTIDVLLAWTGVSLFGIPTGLLLLAALFGWFALARHAEQRFFYRFAHWVYWRRLAITGLAALFVPVLTVALGSVIIFLLHQVQVDSAQPVQVFFGGLWFSAACAGSMVVLTMDRFIGLFRPLLRDRVLFVVLGLGTIALLTAFFSTSLIELLRAQLDWWSHSDIHPFQDFFELEELKLARDFLDGNLLRISLGAHIVSFLLALPAALAAIDKLAASVVEDLEPLGEAFDRVAQGDRHVKVEAGKSRDIEELVDHFNDMVSSLRMAERMERAFGTYVSKSVLEQIRAQHGQAVITARQVHASVLFADIRGFTSMSEKLSPDAVLGLLNRYYARVTEVIDEHDGYLDKFIGDAVVVVWNAPVAQVDHASRAVRCAIEMQKAITEMNAKGAFPEIGELEVGVGIATGNMVAGNVGDASRQMEYTVIGDTVNVAARLCGSAPAGEVWLNPTCAQLVDAGRTPLRSTALDALQLKGKSEPLVPYRAWPAPA